MKDDNASLEEVENGFSLMLSNNNGVKRYVFLTLEEALDAILTHFEETDESCCGSCTGCKCDE